MLFAGRLSLTRWEKACACSQEVSDLDNWRDLRSEAERAHNNRTASYLIGTPMLADYLEEALSQFGKSFEDFEEHL